ncbi:S41 family peptidase [Paraglaciecola marina]|uniref:S41 family peptidase n=1 Tax=Paraglaciecola marina TaxID=2500157 RepID=UPI00105C052D|nr:S41 family peptidase [Paraglaciecola marina]
MSAPRLILFLLFVAFIPQIWASPGYFRYPDLHDNTLVFTAEGDLWKLTLGEQYAQRLTTQPNEEREAHISKDGQWISFVANYTDSPELYIMPIQGGIAKRLTYENVSVKNHGWTDDGKVLYSYNGRIGPIGNWTLKQVDPNTLETTTIPLSDAIEGTLASDDNLYFVRFGLQMSTDNARAYKGGAKGELWKFKLDSQKEASHLSNKHKGSIRNPMLSGERLYFISNQSGVDNLWSMKLNGRDQTQHTHYKDWEVRDANVYQDTIVYQLGADIKVFNTSTEESQTLDISLTSDFPHLRARWINKPLDYLTNAAQASDSKKVVLTARGRVAIANSDDSRLIEIATPKDSRTRNAILSTDNKSVYALNDSSGELEIWQYPADGSEGATQLTTDGSVFRWNLYLSPDGKTLAHDDKNGELWLLDLDTKVNTKILTGNTGSNPLASLTWSKDSQLIALTFNDLKAERSQIMLIELSEDLASNTQKLLTTDKYNSYSPAFSEDMQWLYFLSDREFNSFPRSPWGDRNMGANFDRRTQIFAISLQQDAKFPFSDINELNTEHKPKDESDKDEKTSESKTEALVDWTDIQTRLWQVPVASGNYSKLLANQKYLYVIDKINEPNTKTSLKSIEIKPKPKLTTFTTAIRDFSLSNDGMTLFVHKADSKNSMYLVKATGKFPAKSTDSKVQTSDWKLAINPSLEWQQIFHDAWLMHRDSLFDKNMRGLDWSAVKQKYQPLLTRLTHRNELNDLFEQMMGELNTLHSQVRGGDMPYDKNAPKHATLGAQYEQTDLGLSISHIYQNDPELIKRLAPLARPNVNAKEGDIITAINGKIINTQIDLVKALQNQAGKQVLLDLKRGDEHIKTVVKAASSRAAVFHRYYDWVTQNQQTVTEADDELGYLHLYAMGANDVSTFAREFYAQYKKQGLIIDVRRNRGGNVDSWLIEKLLRRAWSFWQPVENSTYTNMQQTFRGHLVVLADEFTYSDGETFTAGIKALELGKVIGKQTAGAGVWLTGRNRQSDNGMSRVAEYPVFALDGRWITEGRGISPDIEVDNLPYATFNGEDAQLQAAIKYLQKQIKRKPVKTLKAKPFPDVETPAEDIID